ncbi:hypothetical protein V5799_014797, partial [Amblyomma americanum]
MTHMFVRLFTDALNEYTYAAMQAGLSYSLDNTIYGIVLSIRGYNDKQHVLLAKIMDKMTNFVVDQQRFDILREAEYIQNMSDEEFGFNKTALAARRLEKPKKLSQMANKYWMEILSQQYNFDRDAIEVASLEGLTSADLLTFFK